MAITDQESVPLIENSRQPLDLKIDIPQDDLEPKPECCIYKVPRRFRVANREVYTPQLFSIGLLHHGNQDLAPMEKQKEIYYKSFCQRTSDKTLEELESFIKGNINRICRYYDAEYVFKTELEAFKFVKIILYDSVFIIEFFLRCFDGLLFYRDWLSVELHKDLLLLENQLPFFVLEHLYNLAFAPTHGKPSFFHLVCSYFEVKEDQTVYGKGIKHFLDLKRHHVVRTCPSNSDEIIDSLYSATMLHEAGVKFKAVGDCLLDIKFEKGRGVLQIPSIYVDYETEVDFRNLMAFEQCHYPDKAYFCSYIQLLDYLVDNEKDVDLLVKKGIIINGMGSSAAVADMINNLMVGVAQLSLCYDKIGKDLNEYYDNSWNHTKATLKHVYFSNLWRGTGTVAAFLVVVLTLIQTILAILERAMPTK